MQLLRLIVKFMAPLGSKGLNIKKERKKRRGEKENRLIVLQPAAELINFILKSPV